MKLTGETQCALCAKEHQTCVPCRADRLIRDIRTLAYEKWGTEQGKSEWEERCLAAEARVEVQQKLIVILYMAMKKEAWEEGPTDSEAIEAAHDWYHNTFGYGKSADEEIKKLRARAAGK